MAAHHSNLNSVSLISVNSKQTNPSEDICKNETGIHNVRFTVFDAGFVIFSLLIYLGDIATDVILTTKYFLDGDMWWGGLTLLFVFVPSIIIQVFSIRWYMMDDILPHWLWFIHASMLAVIYRSFAMLKSGFDFGKTGDLMTFQHFAQQQSDVAMLRLFESFLESAPQLLLQLYIMVTQDDWNPWTGISAGASLISLSWGVAAYTRASRLAFPGTKRPSWLATALQIMWHLGLVASRLAALLLFAVAYKIWVILFLAIHWLCMTMWVILQKTDFCACVWEERLYNCVVGVVYCFCFFNLKEGQTRYRAAIFYLLIMLENVACWAAYNLHLKHHYVEEVTEVYSIETEGAPVHSRWSGRSLQPPQKETTLGNAGGTVILAGAVVGTACMLVYYRFLHPSGPILPFSTPDTTDNAVVTDSMQPHTPPSVNNKTSLTSTRSFKYVCPIGESRKLYTKHSLHRVPSSAASTSVLEGPSVIIDHIESPSLNQTVCDVHQSNTTRTKIELKEEIQVKKERTRNYSAPNLNVPNSLCYKMQQGATSMPHLHASDSPLTIGDVLAVLQNKETELSKQIECLKQFLLGQSSDLQKRKGISSTLDFNALEALSDELIQKLSSEDGSVSEVLSQMSSHDYENICSVNVNRLMALRSWKTYTDIESQAHDDSIYRELASLSTSQTPSEYRTISSDYQSTGKESEVGSDETDNKGLINKGFSWQECDTVSTVSSSTEKSVLLAEFNMEDTMMPVIPIPCPFIEATQPRSLDTILEETEVESSCTESSHGKPRKRRTMYSSCNDSCSTLVTTIEAIKNSSLDNVYCPSLSDLSDASEGDCTKLNETIKTQSCPNLHKFSISTNESESDDHLTYLEVSFLSKLSKLRQNKQLLRSATTLENLTKKELNDSQIKQPNIRRKFSLLREVFERPQVDRSAETLELHDTTPCNIQPDADQAEYLDMTGIINSKYHKVNSPNNWKCQMQGLFKNTLTRTRGSPLHCTKRNSLSPTARIFNSVIE